MRSFRCFAEALLILGVFTAQADAGEPLPVINSNFANVAIRCGGYAYQAAAGQTCLSAEPAQRFNGATGIGWRFSPHNAASGTGLTGPNTGFEPPSFAGLPFTRAAFLQDAGSQISQTIFGFVAGETYRLSFFLGSRYDSGVADGNQTVAALIDDRIIGIWTLVSYTSFTLRTAPFDIDGGGPHTLKFVGLASGDHTAFFSDVSMEAVAADHE